MRLVLAGLCLAACGRIGFAPVADETTDGQADDGSGATENVCTTNPSIPQTATFGGQTFAYPTFGVTTPVSSVAIAVSDQPGGRQQRRPWESR